MVDLETFYLGFLVRGDNWTPELPAGLENLQEQHVNYLMSLKESGKLRLAGPLPDDPRIRGILIFQTDSGEEAEMLANADPAVKAGRLKVELRKLYLPVGELDSKR